MIQLTIWEFKNHFKIKFTRNKLKYHGSTLNQRDSTDPNDTIDYFQRTQRSLKFKSYFNLNS